MEALFTRKGKESGKECPDGSLVLRKDVGNGEGGEKKGNGEGLALDFFNSA